MSEIDGYLVRTERRGRNVVWVTDYARHPTIRRAVLNAKELARLIPASYTVTVTPQFAQPSVVEGDLFWQDVVGADPMEFRGQIDADVIAKVST